MAIRNDLKQVLYFAVGALATGVEVIADTAEILVKKGAETVKQGKEVFNDFCQKCSFPDDEEPAVVIEEDVIDTEEA